MKPYSQDLRQRAIAALEAGKSQAEVAAQLSIHKSTLEKWWYRWCDTGSCAALAPDPGPRRTLQDAERFIREVVKKQADLTLAELCERFEAATAIMPRPSMMCRELKISPLARKKSRSTTANA